MLAIARENNLSETAFLWIIESPDKRAIIGFRFPYANAKGFYCQQG